MARKRRIKRQGPSLSTILLVLIFIVGLSLLLYPSFADYWNSFTQSRAIAGYAEQVAKIDDETYDRMIAEALDYNRRHSAKGTQYTLTDEEKEEYNKLLNVGGNGVIGYIDIPVAGVHLPVYHGTDEAVLQIAVGHLEWTSLPIGGDTSHTVLSGHRGLPSAKLFTDIDKLVVGDVFMLQILDETLTYEVDQIHIVLPQEMQDLAIEPGRDLCTLVTCTPYGINSHRLLVRGHRIANAEVKRIIRVSADALQIEPVIVAPAIGIVLILLIFIGSFIIGQIRKHR